MSLLKAQALTKNFGALAALSEVSLELETGEVLGIIGPNGAGKSTLFNCLTGILKPNSGKVFFAGRDITGWPVHKVCRLGLVKTSQIVQPFAGMSVLENVFIGGMFGRGLSLPKARLAARGILELVGLADVAHEPSGQLTVARRRRLELARALAAEPKVLLLDENLAGLTPTEIASALESLKAIHAQGTTLVVIEHIMQAVLGLSQRVIVLDYGKKIAEGRPEEVVKNPQVIEAYLGEEYA